jgi:hypothetical protein
VLYAMYYHGVGPTKVVEGGVLNYCNATGIKI